MKFILHGVHPARPEGYSCIDDDGVEWRREGACRQCGQCCRDVECDRLEGNLCSVHEPHRKPFPCVIFPSHPGITPEGCGYRWRRVNGNGD